MTDRPLRSEFRSLLNLAWPIMGAQVSHMTMGLVDNIMVGHLGVKPLASLALANAFFMVIGLFSIGILSSLNPIVAQTKGGGTVDRIGEIIQNGLALGLVLAVCTLLSFHFSPLVFRALGQNPELIPSALTYLQVLSIGLPAHFGYYTLRQMVEGSGHTRPSFIITASGALLHVFGNWILINGKFGMPALGVAGAALSNATIQWLMLGAMFLYIRKSGAFNPYRLFERHALSKLRFREIIHVGLPLGGAFVSEVAFFASATFLMGRIGTVALAGHQIALNAASLTFMVPLGLSIATSVRVGQFAGAQNWRAVLLSGRAAGVMSLGIMCIFSAVFLIFPGWIVQFYTSEPKLRAVAITLLRIAGIFQIFDGLQVVGVGMLRGLKDTRAPFLNTLVAFWGVGILSVYVFGFLFHQGGPGIWYGLTMGLAAAALAHQFRFYRTLRTRTALNTEPVAGTMAR